MTDRCSRGIGNVVRQAQVLSFADEDHLWNIGLLGSSHPQQLLNMVVFALGLSCALRARKEHRSSHSIGFRSQLLFHYDDQGTHYLLYREDIGGKTNKGGLKHRKVSPKVVTVYPARNHERCPVYIVDKYLSKLPIKCRSRALYLHPKANFTETVWFCDRPVGVST